VDFVDDVNLVAAAVGGEKDLIFQFTDIVDRGVACPVYFDYIEGIAPGDFSALFTFSAGYGSGAVGAVQRFGKNTGGGGFTDSPGAGKKVGMGDTTQLNRAFEGGYDKILTYNLFKTLGAFSGGCYFIRHTYLEWRKKTPSARTK